MSQLISEFNKSFPGLNHFFRLILYRVPFLLTLWTNLDSHYRAFCSYSESYSDAHWDKSLLTGE